MIIAIDGPAGTGKSTLAKLLAEKIGFVYCDTGAMYRCLTYGLLKHQIDLADQESLAHFLSHFSCEIQVTEGEKKYFFENEEITEQIRHDRISSQVSQISTIPEVRARLVALQQQFGATQNAVFEGRDIGTVVFPQAELKIFLTALPEIRAKRRYLEMRTKFPEDTKNLLQDDLLTQIHERDARDMNRLHSPLRPAEDAYLIDVSELSIEEVLTAIMKIADPLLLKLPRHSS